ncbi:MAG: diguanylate cyclase [Candidatus Omnitrophota bacterium]
MKVSLQTRLITLMVIFSVLFIAIFTSIQVYNQLNRTTDFNYHRARTGALLLQLNLQNAIKDISEQNAQQRAERVKQIVNGLYSSNIIGETLIIDKDGKVAYSTDRFAGLDQDDIQIIKKNFIPPYSLDKIYSDVDKKTKTIRLFIPFTDVLLAKVKYDLGNIYRALGEVYIPIMITVLAVIFASMFIGAFLSRSIIYPISALNTVTSEVAAGNLDRRVNIKSGDELEELANTFNYMTIELKKMKEKAENANPLTKLPGNIIIREEVERRIRDNEMFLVIYCDLDNFKAFNDKYGIEAGDEAIKLIATILKEAVAKKGKPGDFIGHEGGDDFILLTRPERAQDIADFIITEFDRRIRILYKKEDLERGYIEAKSRQNELLKFPIMSISLAGVTNEIRPINLYGEVTNIAAEMKTKVKATGGSCFLIDRRSMPWPEGAQRPA